MKKIIILLIVTITMAGCHKNNNDDVSPLTGRWKPTSLTLIYYSNNKEVHRDVTPMNDQSYIDLKDDGSYNSYGPDNNNNYVTTTGKCSLLNGNTTLHIVEGGVVEDDTFNFTDNNNLTLSLASPSSQGYNYIDNGVNHTATDLTAYAIYKKQ